MTIHLRGDALRWWDLLRKSRNPGRLPAGSSPVREPAPHDGAPASRRVSRSGATDAV